MEQSLIIGAGGFGREVFAWCTQSPGYGKDWIVCGFLDDNLNALKGLNYPVNVVGPITGYVPNPRETLICAIGIPKVKETICTTLKAAGARFRSVVHRSVVMGWNVTLGEGVVLCPGVTLTTDVKIEDFAMFNLHSFAGHDVVVGKFATVNGHCDLTGHVKIGEAALLASNVTVIPGKKIGARAVVGAGSVVIMNVGADTTVFGNPARRLG
jgi:sugar O-acyltransferase (sialic acid O-acetyltransferase NeuD family)